MQFSLSCRIAEGFLSKEEASMTLEQLAALAVASGFGGICKRASQIGVHSSSEDVLARYGGLRTPSEPLKLRWEDIDWERQRIKITSPKTAHHEGKDSRVIPIFLELKPYLDDVYDLSDKKNYVYRAKRLPHKDSNLD